MKDEGDFIVLILLHTFLKCCHCRICLLIRFPEEERHLDVVQSKQILVSVYILNQKTQFRIIKLKNYNLNFCLHMKVIKLFFLLIILKLDFTNNLSNTVHMKLKYQEVYNFQKKKVHKEISHCRYTFQTLNDMILYLLYTLISLTSFPAEFRAALFHSSANFLVPAILPSFTHSPFSKRKTILNINVK